jgi:quercetin 2,3-dioxygenase
MRKIKTIHHAISAPIDDLITFRAMPTSSVNYIDPFLFLNHHGPQDYGANNNGLPFGPHPHRGFETLTFILKGDLVHWDSGGGKSLIKEGGIQWMTAGRGVIHAEISSEEFKRYGGKVEIIQIWINLPARLKMTDPVYIGLQEDEIPVALADNGKVQIEVVSGVFENVPGPVESITNISFALLRIKKDGIYLTHIDEERNILFYMVEGEVEVNDTRAMMHNLVEFENNDKYLAIKAIEDSTIILGHGIPFLEPVVAQGPFVMNSQAEIKQAFVDYHQGKMGEWVEV